MCHGKCVLQKCFSQNVRSTPSWDRINTSKPVLCLKAVSTQGEPYCRILQLYGDNVNILKSCHSRLTHDLSRVCGAYIIQCGTGWKKYMCWLFGMLKILANVNCGQGVATSHRKLDRCDVRVQTIGPTSISLPESRTCPTSFRLRRRLGSGVA